MISARLAEVGLVVVGDSGQNQTPFGYSFDTGLRQNERDCDSVYLRRYLSVSEAVIGRSYVEKGVKVKGGLANHGGVGSGYCLLFDSW